MTQLVECLRHMEEVRGSSPLLPTTSKQNRTPVLFAFSFINIRQSVIHGLPFCFILRGLDFHYGIKGNRYCLSALRYGVRKVQHFFVKRKAPIFIGAFV